MINSERYWKEESTFSAAARRRKREKIKQDLMPKHRRNVVFVLQLEPGSTKYKKYCIYAENEI